MPSFPSFIHSIPTFQFYYLFLIFVIYYLSSLLFFLAKHSQQLLCFFRNPSFIFFNAVRKRLNISIYPFLAFAKTFLLIDQNRHRDYLPLDDKSNSISDSDLDSLFDISDDKADTTSNININQPLNKTNNNTKCYGCACRPKELGICWIS